MRILIISDIHGNLPALEAVLAVPHDRAICLGDIVGYGPDPDACVDRVRSTASLVVQGNHDRAHGERVSPRCSPRFRRLAEATAPFVDARLDECHREYLTALPRWAFVDVGPFRCLLVHATPRDPLYEYVGPDAARWHGELAGLSATVVLTGHTHIQFDLGAGGSRVVNPGSVGQPKDGVPGAAYALVDGATISLERAAYDIEDAVRRVQEAAAIRQEARDTLIALLRTGRVPDVPITRPPAMDVEDPGASLAGPSA